MYKRIVPSSCRGLRQCVSLASHANNSKLTVVRNLYIIYNVLYTNVRIKYWNDLSIMASIGKCECDLLPSDGWRTICAISRIHKFIRVPPTNRFPIQTVACLRWRKSNRAKCGHRWWRQHWCAPPSRRKVGTIFAWTISNYYLRQR